MQFQLETDELNLLANVSLERVNATSAQASSADRLKSGSDAEQYPGDTTNCWTRSWPATCDSTPMNSNNQQTSLLARSVALGMKSAGERRAEDEMQRKLALLERVLERGRRGLCHGLKAVPQRQRLLERKSYENPSGN